MLSVFIVTWYVWARTGYLLGNANKLDTVALLLAISGLASAQMAFMLLNLCAFIYNDNVPKIAVELFSHAVVCHVCAVL